MSSKYVTVTDALHAYVVAQRSNAADPILEELQTETRALGEVAEMAIPLEQAALIGMLVALVGAKFAIEIGTFTGMSSISIARHLQPGGRLVCFDQDLRYTGIARRYWQRAGVQERIELKVGDARRLLPHYRPPSQIDFVFIDADKESYELYFEALMPYVRNGGLILFDNTLRGGDVIDPVRKNLPDTRAIDQLNRKLAQDPRLQVVLLPIADGFTICRKLTLLGNESRRLTETRRMMETRIIQS